MSRVRMLRVRTFSRAGTDLHVLTDQNKFVSEGLEIVLTQPLTGKGASGTIKLEDLAKLVSNVQHSFKDLDSPKDDHVIIVDNSDEDEEDKTLQWELLAEFLSVPTQVASIQAKIKTLNALLKDDEPIIVQDDSDEEVHVKMVQTEEPKETTSALAPHPISP
nr:hypothetical protein [Tanacetum cinerariifolium]